MLAKRSSEGDQTFGKLRRIRVERVQFAISRNGFLIIGKPCGGVRAKQFVGQERCRTRVALWFVQSLARAIEIRAQVALAGELRQKLIPNLMRFEIIFSDQRAPLLRLLVRTVELQKTVDETQIVREAFVSQKIKTLIEIGVKGGGVCACSRINKLAQVFFGCFVVKLREQIARESLELLISFLPQEPAGHTVLPHGGGKFLESLLIDAQLLFDHVGLAKPLQHLLIQTLLIAVLFNLGGVERQDLRRPVFLVQ